MRCAGLPSSDHTNFSPEGAASSLNGSQRAQTTKPVFVVYFVFHYPVDIMLTVRSAN
jgi:hypothetical protein